MTLAKKKLIIIGSKSTLSAADQLLPELVSLFEVRQWILDLPKGAARTHSAAVFPVASLYMDDKDEGRVAPKKRGPAKLSQSLIGGKPFLRDILNVSAGFGISPITVGLTVCFRPNLPPGHEGGLRLLP